MESIISSKNETRPIVGKISRYIQNIIWSITPNTNTGAETPIKEIIAVKPSSKEPTLTADIIPNGIPIITDNIRLNVINSIVAIKRGMNIPEISC